MSISVVQVPNEGWQPGHRQKIDPAASTPASLMSADTILLAVSATAAASLAAAAILHFQQEKQPESAPAEQVPALRGNSRVEHQLVPETLHAYSSQRPSEATPGSGRQQPTNYREAFLNASKDENLPSNIRNLFEREAQTHRIDANGGEPMLVSQYFHHLPTTLRPNGGVYAYHEAQNDGFRCGKHALNAVLSSLNRELLSNLDFDGYISRLNRPASDIKFRKMADRDDILRLANDKLAKSISQNQDPVIETIEPFQTIPHFRNSSPANFYDTAKGIIYRTQGHWVALVKPRGDDQWRLIDSTNSASQDDEYGVNPKSHLEKVYAAFIKTEKLYLSPDIIIFR